MRTPRDAERAEQARGARSRPRCLPHGRQERRRGRAHEARDPGRCEPRGRADSGEHGREQRAADEEHLLERGLERVGGRAQLVRGETRPDDAHRRRERRQREPGERGDNGDEDEARIEHRERDDAPREERVGDRANAEHGCRAEPVDLTARHRRAHADRDRVDGHDHTRGAIAPSLAPDEEEKGERRHPQRQPAEQRPAEHRPRMRQAEQLAVVPGAAHRWPITSPEGRAARRGCLPRRSRRRPRPSSAAPSASST